MAAYFDSIRNDRATLATGAPVTVSPSLFERAPIYDTVGLVDFLKEFSEDQPGPRTGNKLHETDLSTDLGRRALELARWNVTYDTEANCCEESEPRLVSALLPDAITNPRYRSPVIITHQGRLAAVMKRYGERTIYGFEDIPEYSIYKGLFHAADNAFDVSSPLPKSKSAWVLRLEQSPLQNIRPLRLSTFAVPLKERQELVPVDYAQNGLTIATMNLPQLHTHDTVHELAEHARRNAIPIPGLT